MPFPPRSGSPLARNEAHRGQRTGDGDNPADDGQGEAASHEGASSTPLWLAVQPSNAVRPRALRPSSRATTPQSASLCCAFSRAVGLTAGVWAARTSTGRDRIELAVIVCHVDSLEQPSYDGAEEPSGRAAAVVEGGSSRFYAPKRPTLSPGPLVSC